MVTGAGWMLECVIPGTLLGVVTGAGWMRDGVGLESLIGRKRIIGWLSCWNLWIPKFQIRAISRRMSDNLPASFQRYSSGQAVMDAIEFAITEFSSADEDRKVEIVADFQDLLSDARVCDCLATIISDANEYDLARIKALKILEFLPANLDVDRTRLSRAILAALSDVDDVLVQQWAARATIAFFESPSVIENLCRIVGDPDVDLDVRCNCLDTLERCGSEQVVEALESTTQDSLFGRFASQSLKTILGNDKSAT